MKRQLLAAARICDQDDGGRYGIDHVRVRVVGETATIDATDGVFAIEIETPVRKDCPIEQLFVCNDLAGSSPEERFPPIREVLTAKKGSVSMRVDPRRAAKLFAAISQAMSIPKCDMASVAVELDIDRNTIVISGEYGDVKIRAALMGVGEDWSE